MLTTNSTTVSTKTLKAAQECLGHLTEETGAIVAEFKALQMIAEDTGLPLDGQIMSDCEQMFIAINRLMYDQQSKLKHLQMMKKVGDLAEKTVGNLRRQHGVKTGKKQEATLFNQTA